MCALFEQSWLRAKPASVRRTERRAQSHTYAVRVQQREALHAEIRQERDALEAEIRQQRNTIKYLSKANEKLSGSRATAARPRTHVQSLPLAPSIPLVGQPSPWSSPVTEPRMVSDVQEEERCSSSLVSDGHEEEGLGSRDTPASYPQEPQGLSLSQFTKSSAHRSSDSADRESDALPLDLTCGAAGGRMDRRVATREQGVQCHVTLLPATGELAQLRIKLEESAVLLLQYGDLQQVGVAAFCALHMLANG